jgi:hypothetical protein
VRDLAAYMREYRKRPAVREAELARARAQLQAWKTLAGEYPARYADLYAEALSVQQGAGRGAVAPQSTPRAAEGR